MRFETRSMGISGPTGDFSPRPPTANFAPFLRQDQTTFTKGLADRQRCGRICRTSMRAGVAMNSWRVIELLGVLAEESRYGIVAMLVQAGEDGLPQNRLLSRTGLAHPRLKRHLAKLVKAGVVRRNHRRKGVFWKVDERQLGDLVATMTARLHPQIQAPGRVVEIEAPKAFRTLASKLAKVAPRARRAEPRLAKPTNRRLPSRLTEAIARDAGNDVATADPQPVLQVSAPAPRLALPAPEPAGKTAPAKTRRSRPVRLSDALADVSG